MKAEMQLDPGLEEPVIVLRAPSPTGEVRENRRSAVSGKKHGV